MRKRLVSGEISEDSIHKTLIEWIKLHPQLRAFSKFIMHFPNEGQRTHSFGNLMKSFGMRAGVSDLFIALPRGQYHGAWIELKSRKGRLSELQIEFLNDMDSQNYYATVCYSLEEAMMVITNYILFE